MQGSFKSGFNMTGTDWQLVKVPFQSFSYDWSGFTGRCDTLDPASFGHKHGQQHFCCANDPGHPTPTKPEVCPQTKYLTKVSDVELWAEGVVGKFHLEVKYIAVGAM
jgi:hypothetical protein